MRITRTKLRRARVRFNASRRWWNWTGPGRKSSYREPVWGSYKIAEHVLLFWGERRI